MSKYLRHVSRAHEGRMPSVVHFKMNFNFGCYMGKFSFLQTETSCPCMSICLLCWTKWSSTLSNLAITIVNNTQGYPIAISNVYCNFWIGVSFPPFTMTKIFRKVKNWKILRCELHPSNRNVPEHIRWRLMLWVFNLMYISFDIHSRAVDLVHLEVYIFNNEKFVFSMN